MGFIYGGFMQFPTKFIARILALSASILALATLVLSVSCSQHKTKAGEAPDFKTSFDDLTIKDLQTDSAIHVSRTEHDSVQPPIVKVVTETRIHMKSIKDQLVCNGIELHSSEMPVNSSEYEYIFSPAHIPALREFDHISECNLTLMAVSDDGSTHKKTEHFKMVIDGPAPYSLAANMPLSQPPLFAEMPFEVESYNLTNTTPYAQRYTFQPSITIAAIPTYFYVGDHDYVPQFPGDARSTGLTVKWAASSILVNGKPIEIDKKGKAFLILEPSQTITVSVFGKFIGGSCPADTQIFLPSVNIDNRRTRLNRRYLGIYGHITSLRPPLLQWSQSKDLGEPQIALEVPRQDRLFESWKDNTAPANFRSDGNLSVQIGQEVVLYNVNGTLGPCANSLPTP